MPVLSPLKPPGIAAAADSAVLPRAAGASGVKTSPVGMLGNMFGKVSNAFFILPMIGGVLGGVAKLGKKGVDAENLTGVRGGMTKASSVMRLPDVPTAKLTETIAEVLPKSTGLAKAAQSTGQYAQKALGNTRLGAKHDLVERLGEKSAAQLAVAASMTVGQSFGIVSDYINKAKTVQRMEIAVSGKEPSRISVLLGGRKLSPAVQAMHHREFGSAQSMGATGFRVAGMAFGIRNMFTKKPSKLWVQMAGEMGLSAGASTLGNMNNGADSFQALERYAAANQIKEAPIDVYAGVIAGAAKGRMKAEDVQALAEQCKAQNMTAGETLKFASDNFYGAGTVQNMTGDSRSGAYKNTYNPKDKLAFKNNLKFTLGAVTTLTAAAGISYAAMHRGGGKADVFNKVKNFARVGASVP